MEIFKLVGSIFVDNEKANESLAKTDQKAESVGKTLLGGVKSAGKFAVGMASAATGVCTALVGLASNASSTADTIDKASQRMQIGAESYQELSHAAGLCGVEMSTMEKAAKKLEGTGLNMDDALAEIYALTDAEERSAKAAELFGDSVAYQMTPMLNASAEEMAAMRQEAHDLGLVISEDSVKAGANLNDTLSKVKDSFGAIITKLGAGLIPVVEMLAEGVLQFMPLLMSIIDEIVPVLNDLLGALGPILMELVQTLLPPILELIKALLPLFQTLCEIILPILSKLIKALAEFISEKLIPIITKVVGKIQDALKNAVDNFTKAKEKIVSVFDAIKEGIKKPVNAVIGMINSMIQALNALSFDVPDWVPVLGGKKFGFDLKEIPMLWNGGDIQTPGSVLVGEKGPELLNLPQGARVTPLDKVGTEIDYDKMAEANAKVLAEILPKIIPNYEPVPDETLFQRVRQQSVRNANLGRPGIVV